MGTVPTVYFELNDHGSRIFGPYLPFFSSELLIEFDDCVLVVGPPVVRRSSLFSPLSMIDISDDKETQLRLHRQYQLHGGWSDATSRSDYHSRSGEKRLS